MDRVRKARRATHFEQVPVAGIRKGSGDRRKPRLAPPAAPQIAPVPAELAPQRADVLRTHAMQNAERHRKLAAVLRDTLALIRENRSRMPAENSAEFDARWRRLMQAAAQAAKLPHGASANKGTWAARSGARADEIRADANSAPGEDDDASPL